MKRYNESESEQKVTWKHVIKSKYIGNKRKRVARRPKHQQRRQRDNKKNEEAQRRMAGKKRIAKKWIQTNAISKTAKMANENLYMPEIDKCTFYV